MTSPNVHRGTSRRRFLGYSAAGSAAVMLGTGAWDTIAYAEPKLGYPFTLGVASGDPTPDGVVLWTRLAPDPMAPEGGGGMPSERVPVTYQVATDERFSNVVKAGTAFATPDLGHSVHPEIRGLQPNRHYWYRFRTGSHISPVGRTRTAPSPEESISRLTFGFASCQSYEAGHYTSLQHLAEEDLDLVLHLGDYIYEKSYIDSPTFHDGTPLPDYLIRECHSLADYRLQYALYKDDQHLQAAHAKFPWIVTFDDHEVDGDYDAGFPDDSRKAAGLQAMYENQPLRHDQMPSGPNVRMHRRVRYGTLAEFTMLDSRQYRSEHDGRYDPDATMLGGKQRDWLIDGFSGTEARWQIIGNQQPIGQVDRDPDPDQEKWFASWDAYVVERDKVLGAAHEQGVENLVVVTGDRHSNHVIDLKPDYADPDSPTVGTEFVGTSLSSNRDGADMLPVGEDYLKANPHLKFCNFQRGYSRVTVTADELVNDFRVVPYVSEPGAPISTRATFVVQDGIPGAEPA